MGEEDKFSELAGVAGFLQWLGQVHVAPLGACRRMWTHADPCKRVERAHIAHPPFCACLGLVFLCPGNGRSLHFGGASPELDDWEGPH